MGAAASSLSQFFGRAWKIFVQTDSGENLEISNSNSGEESLRCEFVVEQYARAPWWWADISIWNLNPTTEQTAIKQGNTATIHAGYQATFPKDTLSDPSARVFTGQVFQPCWDRPNVTDYRVLLRCVINFVGVNFLNFTQGAQSTQADIMARMAQQAHSPFNIEVMDDSLSNKKLPRGKALFGTPEDYAREIAHDQQLAMWVGPDGLNVRKLDFDSSAKPNFVFGPPFPRSVTIHPSFADIYYPTLIGVPQQTQEGIMFTVLLDARIKIGMVVQLDFSAVRSMPQIPDSKQRPFLDPDGMYIVAAIRHIGDTRGNDWYTEITGVTKNYWPLATAKK